MSSARPVVSVYAGQMPEVADVPNVTSATTGFLSVSRVNAVDWLTAAMTAQDTASSVATIRPDIIANG